MKRFSTEFPSPSVPTLPEYFKKNTLEGLTPGAIIFPYSHVLRSDTHTGFLYIATNGEIDPDAQQPSFFGERLGVMRLFEPANGDLIDGYIADCRRVKPGNISSEVIHLSENASTYDKNNLARIAQHLKPLLAAVFTDPDGKPHLVGDQSLTDHIETLMDATDRAAEPKRTNEQSQNAAVSEESVPKLEIDLIGSDYYHG